MSVGERFSGTIVALVLGLAMLTGILVVIPDGTMALPEDALIQGVIDDGVDPVPDVYIKVMLFTAGGMDVGYDFTDENGEYAIGVPGGFEYMVIAANGSHYMGMTMVRVAAAETGWANLTLDPIAPVVADITIKGFVWDEEGAPALGGHVLGISNDPMGGDMPFYANVTEPDGTGYFEINVIASSGGGGSVAFDNPGYQMVDNTTESPILSGETYWFNITLRTTSEVDDARISGLVTDIDTGLPIQGVLVAVDVWNMYLSNSYSNFTFTDATGRYEMNVTNGTADVWFTKGGYSIVMYEEMTIGHGDDLQFDAELKPFTCVVRGNITDMKSGLPIQNARAVIMDSDLNLAMASTDETGLYELDAFEGENMMLMAEAEGYSRDGLYVTLVPGEEVWYDFELQPVSAWLEGIVTDVISGDPIENARVWADSSIYSDSSETNETGYYNMSLVPGDYNVGVDAQDYMGQWADITVLDETTNVLNFQLIPWDLEESTLLSGYVTDSDSYDPIEDAEVRVALPGYSYQNQTRTDSDGYYEMYVMPIDGMPMKATAYEHAPYFDTLDCAGLASLSLDIELMPDVYAPNLTMDQSPLTNVSWTNPMTFYAEVEDYYLRQLVLFNFMSYRSEGGYDYLYLIEGASVSFDPFDSSSGLPYTQDGDVYTVQDEYNGTLGDEYVTGGWLSNSTDEVYLTAYKHRWGPQEFYAIRGFYTNDTLTDMPGAAMFDTETGEYVMFYFDWSPDEAGPDDASGVFEAMVNEISIETENPSSWMWLGEMTLSESSIVDIMFVADPILPSGNYSTLFVYSDFGHLGQWLPTPYTVDNEAPVADAGGDQDFVVDVEYTLDGSGSSDNVGIVNYTWEFEDDGVPVTRYDESFDYTFTVLGTYDVTLTVVDGAGHVDSDTVTVDVWADAPPVADAGDDQEVPEDTLVTFDGSGSADDVPIITNYSWTIVSLDVDMYGVAPDYVFVDPGVYSVELVVRDSLDQESEVDSMTVTVIDVTPPVADAGEDPIGIVEGDTVTLDGSDSTDNYIIEDYAWTFTDEETVILHGQVVTYVFENEGVFTVTLTVTDTGDQSDEDTVVVRVANVNDPPVARAGDDLEAVAGDTVTLDGSESSDDVGIESFTWTFEYDDEIQTLTGEVVTFEFEIPGTYIVTLNVTDEDGEWDTDMLVILVEDKASTLLTDYWWLFAAVAAIAVIGALVVLMKRGKSGPGPGKDTVEDDELEEEDLPPPNDEDF